MPHDTMVCQHACPYTIVYSLVASRISLIHHASHLARSASCVQGTCRNGEIQLIKKVSTIAQEFADREAIRACLYNFCRGVDRVDMELVRSSFWPDATTEYGNFDSTSAQDFLEKALAVLQSLDMAYHDLGNIIIDIRGDAAYVESYVRAIQRIPKADGGLYDYVSASRYLDYMERRDDEWRIKHRIIVRDWFREFPDSFKWEDGAFPKSAGYGKARPLTVGQRKPDDRSYELFNPATGAE